jgi:uncharacterized protein (TIGR03083 family)
VDYAAYVAALGREGVAFVAALDGPLDTKVPSCPGWDLARLASHQWRVWTWATAFLRSDGEPSLGDERPDLDEFPTAARRALDVLIRALTPMEGTGAAQAGFWARRMAVESAVHRWDAQSARCEPEPIEAELAADGVDEFLMLLPAVPLRRPQAMAITGTGETLHLYCTDVEGEWLVRFTLAGLEVIRRQVKGDVAVRAGVSAMQLLLWGRVPRGDVEVLGDASILDRFLALSRF